MYAMKLLVTLALGTGLGGFDGEDPDARALESRSILIEETDAFFTYGEKPLEPDTVCGSYPGGGVVCQNGLWYCKATSETFYCGPQGD